MRCIDNSSHHIASRYGKVADGEMICNGGGKRCYTTAFYLSGDDGATFRYASRIDATVNMTLPDHHGTHSSPAVEGPSQASMALLPDVSPVIIVGDSSGRSGRSVQSKSSKYRATPGCEGNSNRVGGTGGGGTAVAAVAVVVAAVLPVLHFISKRDEDACFTFKRGLKPQITAVPIQMTVTSYAYIISKGRILTIFTLLTGEGAGAVINSTAKIGAAYPGGNQGLNLWKAYSSDGGLTWTTPVPISGCRGVRHDPKGIYPQLIMLENGDITMSTGRPNVQFWTSSAKTGGLCWNYSGMDGCYQPPAPPYGNLFGTSGYTSMTKVAPNVSHINLCCRYFCSFLGKLRRH